MVDIYSDMLGQACQLLEEDGYTMNSIINLLYLLPVYIQKSRHVTETELTLIVYYFQHHTTLHSWLIKKPYYILNSIAHSKWIQFLLIPLHTVNDFNSFWFLLYYGKQTELIDRPDLTHTVRVLLTLVEYLKNKGYNLFIDKFYTSPILAHTMAAIGLTLTETVKRDYLKVWKRKWRTRKGLTIKSYQKWETDGVIMDRQKKSSDANNEVLK